MKSGERRLEFRQRPIQTLVDALAPEVGRPIVDKTGLTGDLDFAVEFRPEGSNLLPPPPDGLVTGPVSGDDAPSIFTAVQEQLGLKLEQAKGPVATLVVDHAEKTPKEN